MDNKITLNDLPPLKELEEAKSQRKQKLFESGLSNSEVNHALNTRRRLLKQYINKNIKSLDQSDQSMMEDTGKFLFKLNVAALVAAMGANLGLLNGTKGRIIKIPFLGRLVVRSVIFAIPMAVSVGYSYRSYNRLSMYLDEKYYDMAIESEKVSN